MATIMTVDDARTMRGMVKAILENEGHKIIMAEDGVDALEKVADNKIDMALVDLHMPNMNGTTLVRKLRRLPEYKKIPILMLTTETSEFRKNKARELGANGWLAKPFNPPNLVNAVTSLLEKHAPH